MTACERRLRGEEVDTEAEAEDDVDVDNVGDVCQPLNVV
jgi:hypothetical protein